MMNIASLHHAYRSGDVQPADIIQQALQAARADQHNAWIYVLSDAEVAPYLQALTASAIDDLPLYGIPFAIKDNIDLVNVPTTAACPDFSYQPQASAYVVARLIAAGAIPIGKTNMDQFATGLVGVRSPHGACSNPFDKAFIAGGSSSGSAVAVAAGQVSFALGTDTAGSGRVPAAFNNILGLKPSCGALSNAGVVPACQSLDSVSIFSLNAADAALLLNTVAAYDAETAYSKDVSFEPVLQSNSALLAVPKPAQLAFFGNQQTEALFQKAVARLTDLGWQYEEVDIAPLLNAAKLLYEGAWVAERTIALEDQLQRNPDAVLAVTREIVTAGFNLSAMDAFKAQYQLEQYKQVAQQLFAKYDALLMPTAGTIYRIDEVEAEPIKLNSNLGYYTNFMNLLDLAAVAVPAGFQENGLPFGVTLCAAAGHDYRLLAFADKLQHASVGSAGLSFELPNSDIDAISPYAFDEPVVTVAVCGAHLSGLPLNHQLLERHAVRLQETSTADCYRLYALAGGPPYRPGLVRDLAGQSIIVEVWQMPSRHMGSFIDNIPAPLGIGKVELISGEWVNSFICEPVAVIDAEEITHYGGWRKYIETRG